MNLIKSIKNNIIHPKSPKEMLLGYALSTFILPFVAIFILAIILIIFANIFGQGVQTIFVILTGIIIVYVFISFFGLPIYYFYLIISKNKQKTSAMSQKQINENISVQNTREGKSANEIEKEIRERVKKKGH